jgi:hypothetical protein
MKKIFILAFFFIAYHCSLEAQVVQPRILILPPYPQNLQELLTRQYENIIELQNTSTTKQSVQLRFRLYSDDNNVTASTKASSKSSSPILVPPNATIRLTGRQVANLFEEGDLNYSGITKQEVIAKRAVPEGYYYVCIQAFDFFTKAQLSDEICSNPISMMSIEPPVLRLSNFMVDDTIVNITPQNLIFQWNNPSNLRADALASLEYYVKFIEVQPGMNANQAMQAAPAISPEFKVNGANIFIYGINRTPLFVGRRYAAIVRVADPQNRFTFRNNGRSEVITFVYGGKKNMNGLPTNTGNPTIPPPVTQSPNSIGGRVVWAFNKTEEQADNATTPLVTTIMGANSVNYIGNNDMPGEDIHSLSGAKVELYAYVSFGGWWGGWSSWQSVGTLTTDATGKFSTTIPSYLIYKYLNKPVMAVISHPSDLFNKKYTAQVNFTYNQGVNFGDITLSANSFQFAPQVVSPIVPANNECSVDLLMLESIWKANPIYQQCNYGNQANKVLYNGQKYIVVYTATTGAFNKKLFQNRMGENYVVRINYVGKPSMFYPFNTVNTSANNAGFKPILSFKNYYNYNITNEIEGVVTFQNKPRRDVRIEVSVAAADVLGNLPVALTYSTNTDADGYYFLNEIPRLRKGAVINYKLTDNSIRLAPFYEQTNYDGTSPIKKDIDLLNTIYTITGRVLDQSNLPMANSFIYNYSNNTYCKTSNEGFFVIKNYKPLNGNLGIFSPYVFNSKSVNGANIINCETNIIANKGNEWQKALEKSDELSSYLKSKNLSNANSELLNIGTGNIADNYNNYIKAEENLIGVADLGKLTQNSYDGRININVFLEGKQIVANIKINEQNNKTTEGQTYIFKGSPQRYTFLITPASSNATFLDFTGEFTLNWFSVNTINIMLTPTYVLSGLVKNRATGAKVKDAVVTCEGLPYTATTGSNGKFELLMPRNEQINLSIATDGYDTKDSSVVLTSNINIELNLNKQDPNNPKIAKIGGFVAKIDRIVPSGEPGAFLVDGSLTLVGNKQFTPKPGSEKLTFKNAKVKMSAEKENALPVNEIVFEQAILNALAYGYAPVELSDPMALKMKKLVSQIPTGGNITSGVIGSEEMKLMLSTIKKVSGIMPISLLDASMLPDENIDPLFKYSFISPGVEISALNNSKSFKLLFIDPKAEQKKYNLTSKGLNKTAAGTIDGSALSRSLTDRALFTPASLSYVATMYIERTNATLGEGGIDLNGYLKLPKFKGTNYLADSGIVQIDKFSLGTQFQLKDLTLGLNPNKPLTLKIQKIEASLTSVSLIGLGTDNVGAGIGGTVKLKNGKNPGDAAKELLTIKEFSIVNSPSGVSASLKLALPVDGISIKSLVFKTPNGTTVDLKYDSGTSSFSIEAAGQLAYSGANNTLNGIFPIDIMLFKLNTYNWGVTMAARANIVVNLKTIQITVEKLLVSVGDNTLTLDQMNALMLYGTSIRSTAGGPNDIINESTSAWAFGIQGGVAFPVRGVSVDVKANFLVGEVNDVIEIRVNEIALKVEGSAFKLSARVRMEFGARRQGFEGDGSIETLSKSLAATFKYWYYPQAPGQNEGIELGASIKASLGITTGPIMWHAIGGGFNCNTSTSVYRFWLTGDIGAAGTPKETAYVRDATVEIMFQTVTCGYTPILKCSGTLNMMTKDQMTITADADFCRQTLKITVNGNMPLMGGALNLNVYGLLFAAASNSGYPGCLFLKVNVNLSSAIGNFVQGNAQLGLGINCRKNNPLNPSELNNSWSEFPSQATTSLSTYVGMQTISEWNYKVTGYVRMFWGNFPKYGWVYETRQVPSYNYDTELNAVYVKGTLSIPSKSGGFSVSIAGFDAFGLNYSFSASGNLLAYYNFNSKVLYASASASANASGNVTILGATLYGNANASISLSGGRDYSWWFRGNASLGMQFYNDGGASCNSMNVWWGGNCGIYGCIGWPCGSVFWPSWCTSCGWSGCPHASFKVCKSISAGVDYRQNSHLNVNCNLF